MRLNKLAKKIFAAGLAVSLMMANAGVSFGAPYTPVSGGTIQISKEMTVNGSETVPATVSYSYAVTAEESGAAVPTVQNPTTFTAGEAATGGKISKPITFDFSNIQYSEPGFYKYTVVETQDPATVSGLTNNTTTTKYLEVMVVDDNGTLKVEKSYMYETDSSTKSDKFDCAFTTGSLTFNKTVTGNQGSHDQYFKFSISIPANTGAKFTVTGQDKAPVANAATTYTVDEMTTANNIDDLTSTGTTITHDFYLQHGNSVVISGIPVGTEYTITETAADGYTTTIKVDGETADAATGTVKEGGSNVEFTNNKEGVIPTGVILDSAPFILIIGLAAAALIFTAARKKVR